MVEIKKTQTANENPAFHITSDKTKVTYLVQKANNGFPLFSISADKGTVPKELSGSYTTPDKAIKAVKDHLRTKRPSVAVRRDENTKIREERKSTKNASAVKPDNSKHLQ